MTSGPAITEFASAERTSSSELQRQIQFFNQNSALRSISNAMPNIVLILNQNRETVFSNQKLLDALGLDCFDRAIGRRPGELFSCVHAFESSGGCGTSEFCRTCGAVKAIINGLNGQPDMQECSILQYPNQTALDLRIYTTPIEISGERFTFFSVTDISDEKRRQALERIFFHDILNYAGGLRSLVELLQMVETDDRRKDVQNDLFHFSVELIDEITAQRQLVAAENNELFLKPEELLSLQFINDLRVVFQSQDVSRGKHLRLDDASQAVEFTCDRSVLRRVYGNMVRNALEASGVGDTVTLGCRQEGSLVCLSVHNPRYMPRDVQLRIFNRSFSTKGIGRGLGTYSMKLLGERYLGGKVAFTSLPDEGTTFQIFLPVDTQK